MEYSLSFWYHKLLGKCHRQLNAKYAKKFNNTKNDSTEIQFIITESLLSKHKLYSTAIEYNHCILQ